MSSPALTLFDSHCHLDAAVWGDELSDVIARARAAGVQEMTTIGSNDTVAYAKQAVALAETDPDIHASVGIHPHYAQLCDDPVFEQIRTLAKRPEVVAIGETGLDYHYETSPPDVQKTVFRRFIHLAQEVQKPLIIHVRKAFDDCLQILSEESTPDQRIVIHCFTGTIEESERSLELGCWLSIPGIITFKKAGDIPLAATRAPIDRLLLETDSPYLAPVPKRGKKNEPANLIHIAERVAQERSMNVSELAKITTDNARRFYGLTT